MSLLDEDCVMLIQRSDSRESTHSRSSQSDSSNDLCHLATEGRNSDTSGSSGKGLDQRGCAIPDCPNPGDSALSFDPASEQPPLATKLATRKAHTWGDYNTHDDIDEYDPEDDMFSTYPPTFPRLASAETALEDRLEDLFSSAERHVDRIVQECGSSESYNTVGSLEKAAEWCRLPHSNLAASPQATSALASSFIASIHSTVSSPHIHLLPHHQQTPPVETLLHANSTPISHLFPCSPPSSTSHLDPESSLSLHTEGSSSNMLTQAFRSGLGQANIPPAPAIVSNLHQHHARPSSMGHMKIPRRHKSAKWQAPQPISPEHLKAAILRLHAQSSAQGSIEVHLQHPTSSNTANLPPLHIPSPISASSSSSSVRFTSSSTKTSTTPTSSVPSSPRSLPSDIGSRTSSVSSTSAQFLQNYDYSLPKELWMRIFSRLPVAQLVEMQLVSTSWASTCWQTVTSLDLGGRHESMYSPDVWLRYLPRMSMLESAHLLSSLPTERVVRLVSDLAHLKSLSLHCDVHTTAASLAPIAQLPKLIKLCLWLPVQVPPTALQSLIPHLPRLQYFKVESLRPTFCEKAFVDLDRMESLRLLDLSWCKRLSPSIFAKISHLQCLETLIMDMCGDDVTMSGISHLQALPSLRVLSLKWCDHLTDALLPTLASFPALAFLDVSFCRHPTARNLAHHLPHVSVSLTVPYAQRRDDQNNQPR